jgi:tetratricopeptide (TPR) repeat protein
LGQTPASCYSCSPLFRRRFRRVSMALKPHTGAHMEPILTSAAISGAVNLVTVLLESAFAVPRADAATAELQAVLEKASREFFDAHKDDLVDYDACFLGSKRNWELVINSILMDLPLTGHDLDGAGFINQPAGMETLDSFIACVYQALLAHPQFAILLKVRSIDSQIQDLLELQRIRAGNLVQLPMKRTISSDTPWSQLLRPSSEFIQLVGRVGELGRLRDWLNGELEFSWFVMSGTGGIGKTRLGLELAKEARGLGWIAGYSKDAQLNDFAIGLTGNRVCIWRPLLIVVDYAQMRVNSVGNLLSVVRSRMDLLRGVRVRLLLLEREANEDTGWLHELRRPSDGTAETDFRSDTFGGLLRLAPPQLTGTPESSEGTELAAARQILSDTARSWAAAFEDGRLPYDDSELRDDLVSVLTARHRGHPLALQLVALRACKDRTLEGTELLGEAGLLEEAAARERDHIKRICGQHSSNRVDALALVVERAIAAINLHGEVNSTNPKWRTNLQRSIEHQGELFAIGEVVSVIKKCIGGGDRLTPMAPDLVANAFTRSVLANASDQAHSILATAAEFEALHTWSSLVQLVADSPTTQEARRSASWASTLLASRQGDAAMVQSLLPWMSEASDELLELRVQASLRLEQSASPDAAHSAIALLAGMFAQEMSDEVPFDESEAIRGYADSFQQDPSGAARKWANSLTTLLFREARADHPENVMRLADDVLGVLEDLAEHDPATADSFTEGVLVAIQCVLVGLAPMDLGLEFARANVGFCRRCADRNFEAFGSYLAVSLDNLSSRLVDVELALESAVRAVEACETLAKSSVAWESLLASSLNNASVRYGTAGDRLRALEAVRRAVEIRERLAQENPLRDGPDLTKSLLNLAHCLEESGQISEAVTVYERLVRQRPGSFEPSLAGSLIELAKRDESTGHTEDAISSVERAAEIYGQLAERTPKVFTRELAGAQWLLRRLRRAV